MNDLGCFEITVLGKPMTKPLELNGARIAGLRLLNVVVAVLL